MFSYKSRRTICSSDKNVVFSRVIDIDSLFSDKNIITVQNKAISVYVGGTQNTNPVLTNIGWFIG